MPTIITKTIDAGGNGDFTSFTAAEAAVSTIGTSEDLVANDEAIVFECVAGTYVENVSMDSSIPGSTLTTDATRNVTYKAAAGSEHDGTSSTGARIIFNNNGDGGIKLIDDFVVIDGLVVTTDTGAVGNRGLIQDLANGTKIRNCILDVQHSTPWAIFNNGGGQSVNCVYENNVCKTVVSQSAIAIYTIGAVTAGVDLNNNTIWRDPAGGANRALFYQTLSGGQLTVTARNNFIFGVNNWSTGNTSGGGALTMAGSGNFIDVVGSNMGVGVAVMEGTTSTNPADPSTSTLAIYDATTGALINVPGNDAVGVGTATGAPTTDINGEDRIRDTHVDPGAFTTDLRTITKTIIGAGGGDYATFTAAEGAVMTWPTDTDMVKRNEAIVFEAEAGTYTETITVDASNPGGVHLTTDATRNVTYRAAAGSEHGGAFSSGVNVVGTFSVRDSFTVVDGFSVSPSVGSGIGAALSSASVNPVGVVFRNLMILSASKAADFGQGGSASDPCAMENCVAKSTGTRAVVLTSTSVGTDAHWRMTNCAVFAPTNEHGISIGLNGSDAIYAELTNNVVYGNRTYYDAWSGPTSVIITGSDNVGEATGLFGFPVAQQALSQNWTFSTNTADTSTGNQVIYDATTGALINIPGNDAVGVGTATGVPTTDINGEDRIRDTHVDPGAFTTDLWTITKSIDAAGGGDYTTFTAAEAAVSTLPTLSDLVERNEAIVFEAVAGTYTENVSIKSSIPGPALTVDATRNITYRAAAGSEHGGISGAGVRIQFGNSAISSYCVTVEDDFVTLDNLEMEWTGLGSSERTLDAQVAGLVVRNCLLGCAGPGVMVQATASRTSDSATYPMTFQNCVFNGNGFGLRVWNYGASDKAYTFTNCTITCVGRAFDIFSDTNDTTYTFTNNLVLAASTVYLDQGGGGVSTVLGSGNVGGSNFPFPVAQQAESQTWTFSTNPADLSTGSLVIYDATTGALVNVPGNDAVGVGTTTGAPTTDINGEDRIRGTFADPGAFVAPLRTIGKTIDAAGGGDYTTFTAAEAAVSTLPTLSDLVERNEAIVFEAVAGTYTENVTIKSSIPGPALTMDATRNITYRPAAGSEHGGSRGAGVKLVSSLIGSNTLAIEDDFTIIDGIEIAFEGLITDDSLASKVTNGAVGVVYKNCIIHANGAREVLRIGQDAAGSAAHPIEVLNCIIDASQTNARPAINSYASTGNDVYTKIINNTINGHINQPAINLGSGGANKLHEVTNNISFNRAWSAAGTAVVTGSDNIGPAVAAFPSTLQAEGQAWDFTTDTTATSTSNQVIYDANDFSLINVAGNDAIGVGTATGAPTTDINGEDRIRGAYADPGAFTTELVTINRTIDAAGGGDYTTFTAAEAAVSTLPNDANLVQRNEAIVFEAEAGTYSGQFTPESTLICDATRNVTYKPAAGSEHGGDKDSGVILTNTGLAMYLRDDFTRVEGLVCKSTSTNNTLTTSTQTGWVVDSCIIVDDSATGQSVTAAFNPSPDASNPTVFQNCLVIATGSRGIAAFGTGGYARWSNNTVLHTGNEQTYRIHNTTATLEAYNNFGVGGNGVNLGTATVTGAGNISGNGDQWPTGISAGNQTWTATTNTTANSTGNQVIYDATTGALLNVPGNDAVGVGTVTGAPTTDINGEDRIRDTFADPGAFTAPLLTLTKSIDGAGGGDYTTFTAAEAAVTTFLPSDNLIERNTAIVFEADAGDYPESGANVFFSSSLVSDATRNVKWTFASGSEHGGDPAAGVRCTWLAPIINDSFVTFDGLVFAVTASDGVQPRGTEGIILRNLIVDQSAGGFGIYATGNCGTPTAPLVVENCRVLAGTTDAIRLRRNTAVTSDGSVRVVNNTASTASSGSVDVYVFTSTTGTLFAEVSNNLAVGAGLAWASSAGTTVSGSGNVGGSNFPFPVAQQALSQTWDFTTDIAANSTGNQVIYNATTGALFDVPGNDAWNILTDLTNVPASDIVGFVRQASGFNPGAFEESAPVPPGSVTTGTPADEATLVSIEQVLSWAATTDTTDYDVAFGTSPNPPVVSSGQAATTYDPGTLTNSTTYYWRVDTNGPGGTTAGVEFSFTTIAPAPGSVTTGTPVDGATLVSIEQDLSWAATTDTTDYDVAFGTSPNPPVVSSGQAATSYDPGTLSNSTTYYWSITTNGEGGSTAGTEFSFTTIAPTLGQPTNPSPADGEQNVSVDLASLTWTDPVGTIDSYTVYLSHNTNFGPNDIIHQGPSPAPIANHAHYNQQHYWRVDVTNEAGTTEGPIWSFRVEEEPATGPGDPVVTPTEYILTGDLGFADINSRSRRWDTREGDIRERVFKMTQAQHNISFVYKESLRSMIASFNDIITIDDEQKIKDVKVYHANAERAIAKLSQENNIILPIISISQTVSQDDTDRRRYESILVHEKVWDAKEHRAKRVVSLAPTAVTINYQINIWCKYMSDMDQIIEQIRLKFNPEMNVPTQKSTLAKAMLGGEDDVGSLVAQDKQDRVLQKSFAVSLRTYVENPKFLITNTGEIEKFVIDTDA